MAPLPRDVVLLAPEQFDKLVELLTPGYELAKAYLEQSKPYETKAEEQPETGTDSGDDAAAFRKSAPAPDFDGDAS